jgi:anti-anti-sigma factor
MPVIVKTKGKKAHVLVEGELTIFTAQEVFDQIRKPVLTGKNVEIDLSQVTEMDSAGLQILLAAKLESVLRNTTFSLISHSAAVSELLTLSDLVGFFGDPLIMESETV